MGKVLQVVREVGPYLLVVLLVPGGLLIAPLAWLFRRRSKSRDLAAGSGSF
jgi:hypothetical protein